MIWIVLCTGLLLLVIAIIKRIAKGPRHTVESIESPIRDLLKRGYNNGFLVIEIDQSILFLQLRKYISSKGIYGIELHFPNVNWSKQYFPKIIELCQKQNIQYTIIKEKSSNALEFLVIDFQKNHILAHKIVKEIIKNVFKIDKDIKLFALLENASINNELIDGR